MIILPFLGGWLGIHYWYTKEKDVFNWRLALIPVVALIFGIVTWPLMWHDFPKHLLASLQFHQLRTEISAYYWHYFLVTTPIPIIFGFTIGFIACFFKRSYAKTFLLWWIICVVAIYTLLTIPLSGTRYASVLYLPICIIATYGYAIVLRGRTRLLLLPIILFLIYEQLKVFPYYLDYYNQFTGGVRGAIQKGYDFSWWGEGQAEVGRWLNENGAKGSTVGLIVTPQYVFPETLVNLESQGYVDEKSNADYIVVSHDHLSKLTKGFFMKHQLLYSAEVSGQPLVSLCRKTK